MNLGSSLKTPTQCLVNGKRVSLGVRTVKLSLPGMTPLRIGSEHPPAGRAASVLASAPVAPPVQVTPPVPVPMPVPGVPVAAPDVSVVVMPLRVPPVFPVVDELP